MKRRLLALSAATVAGTLALSGCSKGSASGSTSADGVTTIRFVAADYGSNGQNPSQAYWQGVISAFEQQNPKIKVDLQVINWNDIDTQVKTMVQNGNQPDILQTGGYADFAKNGQLYPAQDVLSGSTATDFLPAMAHAGEQDGTQYGIPFISSARMFLINNALFKKAGLDPADPPKTWADLTADATALKNAGVEIPLGVPLGKEEAQGESFIWMLENHGGYQDAKGKYTINSQANVDTFGQLKSWVDAGLTEQSPASVNRTDLAKDFASGKVGMLNGIPTQLNDVKNMDVTWTAMPSKDGTGKATLGVADWMMAFRKGGHKDQIKAFLDFAYSKDNTVKFDKEYSLLPVTQSALTALQADPDEKALAPFLQALPTATFYPLSDPTWPAVSAQIKTQIGSAVSDPKKTLDALQQAAQQAGE
ncbi:ABC transporter substrate-binding protein [Streptomyces sp. LS1784]|uniref:ABC transporter substrate-binding protein n=1 Tax=Streptomyces sp. LS1784 TaxID=2851533 RepID=UPI001CCB18C7|nr:extracellular solute-binding protein [Streptomyces sp. LS1784]